MAAAGISHFGSAAPSHGSEDYSFYSNLSDDELMQLAIERSLTDTHCNNTSATSNATCNTTTNAAAAQMPFHQPGSLNPVARNTNQPRHSSHKPSSNYSSHNPLPAQTTAHYSSPNPPSEKPPDLYVSSHSSCLVLSNFTFCRNRYKQIFCETAAGGNLFSRNIATDSQSLKQRYMINKTIYKFAVLSLVVTC